MQARNEIPERSTEVLIVGAGVAGLACAWQLHEADIELMVIEERAEAGGNVRTVEDNGFRIEMGPHTILASARDVFHLAEQVGLGPEIVPTRPEAAARFIARGGVLHSAPTGAWSFIKTGLLSSRAKWDLMTEPFRLQKGKPSDTAATFFKRRFGEEGARIIAGAFISGVYAGDPDLLSAPAAFPLFWGFERETGSMIRGAIRHRRRQKAQDAQLPSPPRKGLFSFRHGLGQLSRTIALRLGDRCQCSTPATAITRSHGLYLVSTPTMRISARELVLAVPPDAASRLLGPLDHALAEPLSRIPMAPVAVVHLGFQHKQGAIPEGFGFLVPRGEGVRSLGVLFPSRLFEHRAPGDGDLLAGFVGGMCDPRAL